MKAKQPTFAHRSSFRGSFRKWKFCTNRLRRIFDQNKTVTLRNLTERFHFAAQTKQMNRNHCAEFFSALCFPCATRVRLTIFLDAFLNRGWPDVACLSIYVGKKWSRPQAGNASSGSEKCVRRRDNGIAASDSKRHQNSQQSIGSRRNTNRVGRITICAHRPLERIDFWAKDEMAAPQNVVNRLAN